MLKLSITMHRSHEQKIKEQDCKSGRGYHCQSNVPFTELEQCLRIIRNQYRQSHHDAQNCQQFLISLVQARISMHALSAHHKEIAGIAAAPQKQIERVTKLISNICLILIKNISIKAGHKIDCRQENESKDPLQSFFYFC